MSLVLKEFGVIREAGIDTWKKYYNNGTCKLLWEHGVRGLICLTEEGGGEE